MSRKTVITALLLFFVGASVVTLIVKETKSTPDEQAPEVTEQVQGSVPQPVQAPTALITVYYFHGNVRCATCMKLEKYAQEAIETGFGNDLKTGTVVWQPTNIDEPANQHYVQDYNLFTKAVIISESLNGQETRWVNLDKIWDLVSAKDEYVRYIQTELKTFLGRV